LPACFDFLAARIYDHPLVGNVITETARALNDVAIEFPEHDGIRLFNVLLDLVAFALCGPSGQGTEHPVAGALTVVLRREIQKRLHRPDLFRFRPSQKQQESVIGTFTSYLNDRESRFRDMS
jgi:hypothetical protein